MVFLDDFVAVVIPTFETLDLSHGVIVNDWPTSILGSRDVNQWKGILVVDGAAAREEQRDALALALRREEASVAQRLPPARRRGAGVMMVRKWTVGPRRRVEPSAGARRGGLRMCVFKN